MLHIASIRSRNEVYMSNKIETNQKHMNQDNRVVIEKGLDTSKPLSIIAVELGKNPTTISKEIKKHRSFQEHNRFNEPSFRCALAKDCHRKHVCSTELFCKRECKRCNKCHNFCKDFVPFDYACPKTKKAPYVCNGCSKKSGCRLDKYYYRATRAHKEYKTILVEARAGINASEEQIKALDDIVSPLVENGQSVYTILQNHPEISQCEKLSTITSMQVFLLLEIWTFQRRCLTSHVKLMELKLMIPVFSKVVPIKTFRIISRNIPIQK